MSIVLKFAKEMGRGIRWFWKELSVDWFARAMVSVLVVGAVWGWYLYFTKPPKVVAGAVQIVNGKPVTVTRTVIKFKPYMGGTVNEVITPQGVTVTKSKAGLCVIPKVGAAYVFGDGFSPALTVRVAYLYRLGLEFGACAEGPMLGVDFQNLILNGTTLSGGLCPDIVTGEILRPYAAAGVAFRY